MADHPDDIVLWGAGGHAKVVADAVAGCWRIAAVIADAPAATSPWTGTAVVVTDAPFEWLLEHGSPAVFVAFGANGGRRVRLRELERRGFRLPSIVHPRAIVASDVEIGPGAFVGPGAIVNSAARIGPGAIVNSGAIVEHDCQIGEAAHIAPGAVLGGGVRVGDEALVGLGARVSRLVTIGDRAIAGAGSVVIADVPAETTVAGVPAKPVKDSA